MVFQWYQRVAPTKFPPVPRWTVETPRGSSPSTHTKSLDPKSSLVRSEAKVLFPAAGGPNNHSTWTKHLMGISRKKNGIWYHSSCYFMAILICKKIIIEWFVVLDGENGSFTQLIHGHFVGENYHLSQDTSRDAKRKYWNKESELDDLNIQNEQCSKPATLFLSTACF